MAPRRSPTPTEPVMIAIGLLVEDPSQPRQIFNDSDQQALNESVRLGGINVPLEVRPTDNNQWVIIKGTRRFRAAKNALLSEVPCVLGTTQTPRAIHSTQVLENSARADLDPLDRGQALFIEFLADQIAALAEEKETSTTALDHIFSDQSKPTERIAALSDLLCRLSGAESVGAYLQSNMVRVPWKTVLARLGLSTLSDKQRKQLLQPVRDIPLPVQELLAGGNVSGRVLSTLSDLDPDQQHDLVTAATQQTSTSVSDALRNALKKQEDDEETQPFDNDDDASAGFGASSSDPAAMLGERPARPNGSHDDDIQPFLRESGNAPRLVTDQPPPARGSTPPAGHGTMSSDGFTMFTSALEAVLSALDFAGDAPLSEDQHRAANVLWGEILERGENIGLSLTM